MYIIIVFLRQFCACCFAPGTIVINSAMSARTLLMFSLNTASLINVKFDCSILATINSIVLLSQENRSFQEQLLLLCSAETLT